MGWGIVLYGETVNRRVLKFNIKEIIMGRLHPPYPMLAMITARMTRLSWLFSFFFFKGKRRKDLKTSTVDASGMH